MKSLEEVKAGLDLRGVQGGGMESAGWCGSTVESWLAPGIGVG